MRQGFLRFGGILGKTGKMLKIVRRSLFIVLLAASLASSLGIRLSDKGRDPPDPPAMPTIIDAGNSNTARNHELEYPKQNRTRPQPEPRDHGTCTAFG